MIVLRGYPSSIITKGYATGSGDAASDDGSRNDRGWQDQKTRPWWWKKNISPKLAQVEAPQQP